ncbi:hypothetical protein [Prolixibacter sp. NT017]|uniref:hypothetical protein n=1 Tax=Prolixibacter sp. NT017 TaxID=2652390 RepID=UPI0012992FFB|nr:hypothetical protein [Prolixibacter sp. NT017]
MNTTGEENISGLEEMNVTSKENISGDKENNSATDAMAVSTDAVAVRGRAKNSASRWKNSGACLANLSGRKRARGGRRSMGISCKRKNGRKHLPAAFNILLVNC